MGSHLSAANGSGKKSRDLSLTREKSIPKLETELVSKFQHESSIKSHTPVYSEVRGEVSYTVLRLLYSSSDIASLVAARTQKNSLIWVF